MFIKPAAGVKVRDPASKLHIPETGVEVPDHDTFWTRRLLDGDVVLVQPAVPAPAAKAGKEK